MNLRLYALLFVAFSVLAGSAMPPAPAASPSLPNPPPTAPTPTRAAGAIEGVVHLPDLPERTPPLASPYARRRYRPPAPSQGGSLEDVVVFVALPGEGAEGQAGRVTQIVQEEGEIVPRVIPVQVGTQVEFPNHDDVYHNLFSLSSTQPFNLGRYPPGESRSVTFPHPGVVRMFCDIHSDMSGVIHVLDTPYFVKPNADGEFRITGVPDGRHSVVAWHEAAGADSVEVVVSAGSTVRVELRPGRE